MLHIAPNLHTTLDIGKELPVGEQRQRRQYIEHIKNSVFNFLDMRPSIRHEKIEDYNLPRRKIYKRFNIMKTHLLNSYATHMKFWPGFEQFD